MIGIFGYVNCVEIGLSTQGLCITDLEHQIGHMAEDIGSRFSGVDYGRPVAIHAADNKEYR